MKKGVLKTISVCFAVCVMLSTFSLSACCTFGHTYSDLWTYDEQCHYHAADCNHRDEKSDGAEHDGDICSVCGYVAESLATTGFGVNEDGYVYSFVPDGPSEKPNSIVIPSFYQGIRVMGIAASAFNGALGNEYFSDVTRIVLPSGIKRVCRYSWEGEKDVPFSGTAYYKDEANWQDGLLYIGNCLIAARYEERESLNIKDGTRTIADYLLGTPNTYPSNQPSEITLPHSLETIGDGAFYHCKVESITIPANVTLIGRGAFCVAELKEATFETPNGWTTWVDDTSKMPTYMYGFWVYPTKEITLSESDLSNPAKAAVRLNEADARWVRT